MFQFTPSLTLLLSVSTISAVSASLQTGEYKGCIPDFADAGMTIINNQREWAMASAANDAEIISRLRIKNPDTPEFDLELRDDEEGFTIKEFNNHDLIVAYDPIDSILKFKSFDQRDGAQMWNVFCSSCDRLAYDTGSFLATDCLILNVANSFCVQVGPNIDNPMYIATCNGDFPQQFDFWVAAEDLK
ncbi:hypothetical protein BDZ89DRAFT_1161858 [Hymenopellis radicata]|nr:hypothetical protein BDZ89DRAFT_1161858 [Hymenopellis radicata]